MRICLLWTNSLAYSRAGAKDSLTNQQRRDLVATVKDVSGEGLALGLSPLSAVANYGQAFEAGVSASGSWDKVELLPWSLLHPAGPPSWGEGREATVRWRFHVVDLRAKPTEFHAGNKNLLHLTDGAGNWEQTTLLPGILTMEICLQRSLPLHVQVGPCQLRDGQADEQEARALVLADKLCLCLDHRRPETGPHCFCPEALLAAAAPMPAASEVVNWDSTADYMASWRPAVELEAAASAADEDDTRILSNVEITWGETGVGSFVVPSALASAHRMKMRGLIRGEDGPTEWSSGWLCLRLPAQQSSGGIGWRGHAGIVDADLVGDDGNAQPLAVVVGEEDAQIPLTMSLRISFQMVPGASDSSGTPGIRKTGYLVEFIPKSLPYSCMAVALAELSSASPLLREVVLQARAPAPGRPGPAASQRCLDDEASWHSEAQESFAKSMDLKPWRLNPPQEAAVRGSLEDALSLIHGPPGTGKTTTAAALCVLYALWNLDCGQVAAVLYCTPSNDAADVACLRVAESSARHFQALATKRRQEVVAAGTSEDCPICFNGSCDVITACGHQFHRSCLEQARAAGNSTCPLCRRPLRQSEGGLTALRVYSAEMERGDFPVPKRIDHPSAKPRKVKTVSEAMRPFALHWRCHGRAPGVEPTAESLEAGAAYERMLQAGLSSPLFDELRTEYYLALSAARAAELRRTDVVFATCISARRGGLAAALQAPGAPELLQVVLDEAGQAPEPEALCPMTLEAAVAQAILRHMCLAPGAGDKPPKNFPEWGHLVDAYNWVLLGGEPRVSKILSQLYWEHTRDKLYIPVGRSAGAAQHQFKIVEGGIAVEEVTWRWHGAWDGPGVQTRVQSIVRTLAKAVNNLDFAVNAAADELVNLAGKRSGRKVWVVVRWQSTGRDAESAPGAVATDLAKNAKKIVMVGDPKQLRPIVVSPQAERMGLNISLLERLSDAPAGKPRLLSLQYRMHEELNEFPAAYFYSGRVRTDPAVLARRPGRLAHPTRPMNSRPFLFWSSHGGPSEQISQVRSSAASAKSRFNPAEALRAAALARSLAAKVGDSRVAVLTWYNAQVAQLSEALAGTSIHIGGVVSSQGNAHDGSQIQMTAIQVQFDRYDETGDSCQGNASLGLDELELELEDEAERLEELDEVVDLCFRRTLRRRLGITTMETVHFRWKVLQKKPLARTANGQASGNDINGFLGYVRLCELGLSEDIRKKRRQVSWEVIFSAVTWMYFMLRTSPHHLLLRRVADAVVTGVAAKAAMPLVEKANVRMRWWWRVSRSCGNVDGPPNFQEVSLAHVLDWLLHSGSLIQEEVEISVVGPSLRVPCFQGIYFGHADDDDVSFAFGFWTDVSLKRLLTKVALSGGTNIWYTDWRPNLLYGEWDYVLLSTVRSSPGGLGALEDEHLLDVALTRARLGMCVLGAPETLSKIRWSFREGVSVLSEEK
ncbi:Helicase with zinc finger domain 2 [Symbiodinium microadriaticum]|uniref:Helicase with zinc finger domain 2 n=1 Tax=Symbiodinium microadriaticum TaxID=2951 RepID=A0A1Q9ECC3_SYMMI|nr:Helicase with zinc finger domain 2 [Symbiodinium microadriaticum]